jgi:membrane protein DedA with SNARE-associated domain
LIYLTVALIVFAEDALFVGFLLPGETAAILGGVTASTGHTNVVVMAVTVVLAAILGDSAGYEVGQHWGGNLLRWRPLARRGEQIDRARGYLAHRGGPAVFLGRYVAFLRAMMPFLAGTSRMRYRTFLVYNATGGITWGVANVLIGYLAGRSYQRVAATFGKVAAAIVGAVLLVVVIVYLVRRHRKAR